MQQQTAEMEQKLDAMAMVMGGLGVLEIQDDIHQEPKVKAAGLFYVSVLNSNTIFHQRTCLFFLCLKSTNQPVDQFIQFKF